MHFNFRVRDLWGRVKPKFRDAYGDMSPRVEAALEKEAGMLDHSKVPFLTWRTVLLVIVVSMGGFIFGYHTAQISGFMTMEDFKVRFAHYNPNTDTYTFNNARTGVIVALICIGCVIGAVFAAPLSEKIGRKYSMVVWSLINMVGIIVQMTTDHKWYQVAVGRLVAGLGVGALSVLVPIYQSECTPKHIRGAMVSCFQLFVTLGMFIAYCINYGTESIHNTSSWRITMGIGFVWSGVLAFGVLFLPESPRHVFRKGHPDLAKHTMSQLYGVSENHRVIAEEITEMKYKLQEEEAEAATTRWYDAFTAPRMLYRIILGMVLQSLQQLTGANFIFYYGNTIFRATGINNSYVTQMILGGVNFGTTFYGLYVVEHYGRRLSLMVGAGWMFICFMVFASVGHFSLNRVDPPQTPGAGTAMIVFACFFITGYAVTWGPIVWAVCTELYPSRYRSTANSISTLTNWIWNFLISFFTPFITGSIDFRYGYIFAACNFMAVIVVYFFLCETQGRTLEEVDTMYIEHVHPWSSKKWTPPIRTMHGAKEHEQTESEPEHELHDVAPVEEEN
ncbi:hypothetical protein DTO212C5_6900 [Paecilomyces variotii]|nr:hypothetical protein DTO212C5_6900 [Paecilomyces variotii]